MPTDKLTDHEKEVLRIERKQQRAERVCSLMSECLDELEVALRIGKYSLSTQKKPATVTIQLRQAATDKRKRLIEARLILKE